MFQVPFAVMKSSSPLEVAKKRRPPSHFQTAGRGAPDYSSGEPFHRPKGLPWSKPERPSGAPNEDRLPKKRGR